LNGRYRFVEPDLRLELQRLLDEVLHQVLRENLREATYVEDVLLGVERRELPAEFRQ
jgi:hypothetical protein